MFGKTSWFSAIVLVLAFAAIAHCEKETSSPRRTYVSALEKTLKVLSKPFEVIDGTIHNIQDGLKDAWWKIRGKKDVDEGKQQSKNTLADLLNKFSDKVKAIYPGTRWCGDGDIAESDDDLGFFKATDACCRAHDKCPEGLTAGTQNYGLVNNGIFTRSHCDCDEEFYSCLKEARGLLATKIGTTYFNILRPQCFRKEQPVDGCKVYARNRLIDDKCLEYKFNSTGEKAIQWFDTPDFFNL